MNSIKTKKVSEKTNNQSNIILAIIYLHQNFKFNISTELIYEKFKNYKVKKIKIIKQNESIKAFIELIDEINANKIIDSFHNTFDFYGKWKIYFSKKKKIILTKKNSNIFTESNHQDTIKFLNDSANINIMTPTNNFNIQNTLTPQIKKIYNINEVNFNIWVNNVLSTMIRKKIVLLNKCPSYFKVQENYNFFGLFGNLLNIYYNKKNNKSIIVYYNLKFEDRLKFCQFLDIFNKTLEFEILEYNSNFLQMEDFEKITFNDKYNRYNNEETLVFPSNIIKIINIGKNVTHLKLYKMFIKENIEVNKFCKIKKNNKIRFYFQFSNFNNSIKALCLFHLKKIKNKKIFLQFTSLNIKL